MNMAKEKMTVYLETETADEIRHYSIDAKKNIGEVVTLAWQALQAKNK